MKSSPLFVDKRRQEMIKKAEEYFARRSEMPIYARDDASEKLITLEVEEKNGDQQSPLIIITQRIDGVTPDMWNWYEENEDKNSSAINKANQVKYLENHQDDQYIMLQRIITPPLVRNRSIITTGWRDFHPEDTSLYIKTSIGNRTLVHGKYSKEIGKNDVIATCLMTYFEVTPNDNGNGIYVKAIINVDVGSLPKFINQKISRTQCKTVDNIINYIEKNYKYDLL